MCVGMSVFVLVRAILPTANLPKSNFNTYGCQQKSKLVKIEQPWTQPNQLGQRSQIPPDLKSSMTRCILKYG